MDVSIEVSNGSMPPQKAEETTSNNTGINIPKNQDENETMALQAAFRRPFVVAVEEDDEDIIPGPPLPFSNQPPPESPSNSRRTSALTKLFGGGGKGGSSSNTTYRLSSSSSGKQQLALMKQEQSLHNNNNNNNHHHGVHRRVQSLQLPIPAPANSPNTRSLNFETQQQGELDISLTEHRVKGNGILASRADLNLAPEEFAAGCNLLQAAAAGHLQRVQELLQKRPHQVNFRDYDRRTALHVAASEGHLQICQYLVLTQHAKINRSDRWGGSPLDDAHRHRHREVVLFLRQQGAITGSGNQSTILITAAAEGDVDEVQMLLTAAGAKTVNAIVSKGDYDKRTPLHLAASEGHAQIVLLLCNAGANVNAEDRWGSRPLDDAVKAEQKECANILQSHGAKQAPQLLARMQSSYLGDSIDTSQTRREQDNLKVDFEELEMVDRIGSGAFGEIFKCRWRGTMVAAKCIKSAKIRQDWVNKRALESIEEGADVDEAMRIMDEAAMDCDQKEEALMDFRQEISVLKSLRHPHIVLLLAFSTTENYEVMISELMECSLLDVFKAHQVHGTRLAKKSAISYALQLARGMNYLHTCKPPVIHRDLKPANLLLDHTGVLKISDFGLAKVRPDPKKMEQKGRFMTGETGSYRFMAPEVFRHEDYNETVDVYSYAMILHYLLDGRPPWPTLNGLEAVRRASEEGDRPIIPRNWDQRLTTLLMECWDENSSARPPFKTILQSLDTYSRDVFHNDDITKSARRADTGCNCTIM
ncbi:Mitogen-activated protein kinase HOG1 (Fragment) [Seminavis robusta]|uniref:Mitogen-activated protein kinase HOG1 n=1 Tax=Seminavis robusta TaxID=568900 RepID=A0A9N8H563_9STRA